LEIAEVLSPDECSRVISDAIAGQSRTAALVGGAKELAFRRAQIYWLGEQANSSWIFDRMLNTVAEVNRHHFGFQIEKFSERMQVSR